MKNYHLSDKEIRLNSLTYMLCVLIEEEQVPCRDRIWTLWNTISKFLAASEKAWRDIVQGGEGQRLQNCCCHLRYKALEKTWVDERMSLSWTSTGCHRESGWQTTGRALTALRLFHPKQWVPGDTFSHKNPTQRKRGTIGKSFQMKERNEKKDSADETLVQT